MITYINKPLINSKQSTATINRGNESGDVPAHMLSSECVQVPHGFIVTAFAFEEFLTYNSFHLALHSLMQLLDTKDYSNLLAIANTAQSLLSSGKMPPSLRRAIVNGYQKLGINEPVVVDSHNFTVNVEGQLEDTTGEHENIKTVSGEKNVLAEVQNCFAALYTEDAIRYRQDNGYVHNKAALSITIQKMQRLPKPGQLTDPCLLN